MFQVADCMQTVVWWWYFFPPLSPKFNLELDCMPLKGIWPECLIVVSPFHGMSLIRSDGHSPEAHIMPDLMQSHS